MIDSESPMARENREYREAQRARLRPQATEQARETPEPLTPEDGLCPTRRDNQPTPSDRPWRYGHAASVEGAHWNIYAGEGIDGWLVGMVTTEADAALIVDAVNAAALRAATPDPAEPTVEAMARKHFESQRHFFEPPDGDGVCSECGEDRDADFLRITVHFHDGDA
jgi:hypothetical protein